MTKRELRIIINAFKEAMRTSNRCANYTDVTLYKIEIIEVYKILEKEYNNM